MDMPELDQVNKTNSGGIKRLIGTVDQDYFDHPDAKRLKLLKAKGEEEFQYRAVKVLESNLQQETNDLHVDIEEIEECILKVQQYLHTIRYHASLNLYAYDKIQTSNSKNKSNNKSSLNHPTLKRHLGHTSSSLNGLSTSELLSEKSQINKNCISEENQSVSDTKNITKNKSTKCKKSDVSSNPVVISEQSPTIITQRRKERFQKRVKIIIGNTYRYIKDEEDPNSSMKFQWRAYVRTTDIDTSVGNFISAVKFTLDKSYAPNDEITVNEPPFSLCRRGWGEFKLFLTIVFVDPRNKPVHLIHPLTLSRVGDPLAFTGLWRLGKEEPYGIWLFIKDDELTHASVQNLNRDPKTNICEESIITKLKEQGIQSETLYKDEEGHVTLSHSVVDEKREDNKLCHQKGSELGIVSDIFEELIKADCSSSKKSPVQSLCAENRVIEKDEMESNVNNENNDLEPKEINSDNGKSPSDVNKIVSQTDETKKEENVSQIWIKQKNGNLVPVKVPKALYDLAVKRCSQNIIVEIAPEKSNTEAIQTGLVNNNVTIRPTVRYIQNNNPINKNIGLQLKPQNQHQQALLQARGQMFTVPRPSLPVSTSNETVKLKSVTLPSKLPQPISKLKLQTIGNKINLSVPQNNLACSERSINIKTVKLSDLQKPLMLNKNLLPLKASPNVSLKVNNVHCVQPLSVNSQTPIKTNKMLQNSLPIGSKIILKTPLIDGNKKILYSLTPESQRKVNSTSTSPSLQVTQVLNNVPHKDASSVPEAPKSISVNTMLVLNNEHKTVGQNQEVTTDKHDKDLVESEEESDDTDDDPSLLLKWFTEKKLLIRSQCKNCLSVEEVLRIYLRGISLKTASIVLNLKNSTGSQSVSEGRKRAMEFWRAREIRKELQILNVKNCQSWNAVKIVIWAREHGYMALGEDQPELLGSTNDEMKSETYTRMETCTPFNDSSSHQEQIKEIKEKLGFNDSLEMDVDVVDVDEEKKTDCEDEENSSDKKYMVLSTSEMTEENSFIDEVLSKVRNRFELEEIGLGLKMDLAKNILYKATMSFMEDLIRSSYAVAASDNQIVVDSQEISDDTGNNSERKNEVTLEKNHVLSVLLGGRLGFKSLTRFGVGKKFIPWS